MSLSTSMYINNTVNSVDRLYTLFRGSSIRSYPKVNYCYGYTFNDDCYGYTFITESYYTLGDLCGNYYYYQYNYYDNQLSYSY